MKLPKKIVKLLFWGLIPLLVMALASGQGNAAQEYQFYDLGALGGNESEAHGINISGWVVGYAQTASGNWHAFLKKPDADMEDLGTLGGNYSSAQDINAGGWVAGESETTPGVYHAFLKKPGVNMEDLGTLGGNYSYAYGINDSGWVVGESETTPGGTYHAFLKKPGVDMEDLGTLGGTYSYAQGINASGWVVGESFTANWENHAFLKKPGVNMEDLGTLGGTFSSAYGINDSGWVVGESDTASGDDRPFLKKASADMEDLGTLGGTYNYALGINDNGWVVGVSQIASGAYHAFLKKAGVNLEDLNNLVQLPATVILGGALAINYNGWIVGYTLDTSTQLNHAFLLIASLNNVKPVANAGTSQSVALGDTVYLNGTGSYDPNGLPLVSYTWSFVSVPAGSTWAGSVLYSATPSFTPDLWGTYVITLVVNNGSLNSDPSTVNVLVTVTGHSAILSIQKLQTQISDLKPDAFKNANMQNALLNKLNAVIATIDAGDYVDALNQLQQDILGKVTGKNSWITNPSAQTQIYKILTPIIAELKALS